MTREEAKEIFLNRGFVNGLFDGDKWRESIVVISEWLEQEPCDCISRQAVMDCFKKWQPYMATRIFEYEQELKALPSIQPKQKTGHWIEHPHEAGENWEYSKYECSECHVWANDDSDYCPNCGAKMSEIPTGSEKE